LSKAPLETQQKYHFIIEPELNTFNGNTKVQLAIKDYRPATHSIYINPTAYEGDSSGADQATASPSKLVIPSVTSVKPALVQTQTHTTVTKDSSQADQAPEPSGEASASDKSSQPFWIDHRNREGIDQFMQQLMLPAQQGRTIRLFHEGRPPSIPFLDHTLLHNRHQVQSSLDELILWDLPPDMETLTHILQVTQPSVVHWVGGKYQSVPLNPNPRDFLKVILQGIRREAQSGGDRTVALSMLDFAASLASNRTVVMNGLLLLNRLELLQVKTTDEVDRVTVSLPETPGQGVENIAQLLEYMAFQDAIRQVSRFRSWLMTSALDTIRESLRQPSENFVMSKREPVRQ
jgi:hypothetical protein